MDNAKSDKRQHTEGEKVFKQANHDCLKYFEAATK